MKSKVHSGQYQEIIERTAGRDSQTSEEITELIAAYSFLGRIEEAEELFLLREASLPENLKIQSRFFLGIALTRVSRLKEARAFFELNLKKAKSAEALPYAWQGVAFFLYFLGQFKKATKRAQKALRLAIAANNSYLHFLAMDLLGHCFVQIGRRPEGVRLMRNARRLAEKAGNLNFADAIGVAILIYESEIGLRPDTILQEIEMALSSLRAQDSYTRNNLILEYARQLTLRGRWQEARLRLDRESSAIYAFANRRQELVLQLRLTELALRQGDYFSAEHFVQAGKRCLNRVADKNYEIRLLGIEGKLRRWRGSDLQPGFNERLLELSREHSTSINQQILFRQGLRGDPGISASEDPLGYLFFQSTVDKKKAAQLALQSGYLGLWAEFYGISGAARRFVILEDLKSFVAVAPNGVFLSHGKLSRQQIKILQCLSQGLGSKEKLAQQVWGYTYEPLRHDPMIYSAITKLRQLLGPYANWIVTNHLGWQLANEVEWDLSRHAKGYETDASAEATPRVLELPAGVENLNTRQIRALADIKNFGIWTIKTYKTRYKVSTMTAFRDLNGLRDHKFLVRIGEGRATRYYEPKTESKIDAGGPI